MERGFTERLPAIVNGVTIGTDGRIAGCIVPVDERDSCNFLHLNSVCSRVPERVKFEHRESEWCPFQNEVQLLKAA